MGVDNDSKTVFGIELSYDEFKNLSKILGDIDLIDMIWNDDYEKFNQKYPKLYLGYASPVYDGDYDIYGYYIGIGQEQRDYSLNDLKELLLNWEESGYRECLEELGIDFEEPRIFSLPHVY